MRGSAEAYLIGLIVFCVAFVLVLSIALKGPNSNPQPPVTTELHEVARGAVEFMGIDRFGKTICNTDDSWWSQVCWCKRTALACWAHWQVQHVTLATTDGRTIIDGLEYIENTLSIPISSQNLPPLKQVNPRFNCHGFAMLKSQYWLNDPLPLINDPRLYARLADESERARDDVVTYWNANGEIEHSAILIVRSPTDARADTVHSKPGKGPDVQELPRGPGLGTAWEDPNATVVYYRPRNP
jgi:hypothetical protein